MKPTFVSRPRMLGLFVATVMLVSPQSSLADHPVVALVLGGGGALGLAHVGVITELEKAGVSPDIVVGTSMGAVIGSLYAVGYNAEELREIADDIQWDVMFRDASPRRRLAFRRKAEDRVFSTPIKLGFENGSIKLPRGLIRGRRLENRLTKLLSSRSLTNDFDDLPRRFKTVATDIETFEPVVLESGDLASAVFASMAVPGLLPPQELNGKTLLDGGLASNVPVHLAREMGADILIVVNLSTIPSRAEDIKNILDVVSQITAFLTLQNAAAEVRTLGPDDILMQPDLSLYSGTSFDKSDELIELGAAAAREHRDEFERIAALVGANEDPPRADVVAPIVTDVRIQNDTTYPDRFVLGAISQPLGEPIDYDVLSHDLDVLYGVDEFSNVTYRLDSDNDAAALIVSLKPKVIGDTYLRAGLTLVSDFQSKSDFNILAGLIRRNVNSGGGEFRGAIQIGDDPGVFGEFYQPKDVSHTWFTSVAGSLTRDFVNAEGESDIEITRDTAHIEATVGRVVDRIVELRLGIAQDWSRVGNIANLAGVRKLSFRNTTAFAHLSVDSFDHPYFPTHGILGRIELDQNLYRSEEALGLSRVGGDVITAFPFVGGVVLSAARVGITVDDASPVNSGGDGPTFQFPGTETLGGPWQLSGKAPNSLRGRHRVLTSLTHYRPLTQGGILTATRLYAGASVELGNTFDSVDEIKPSALLYGASLFVGAETLIGPIMLGCGVSNSNVTAFLRIGQSF